MSQQSTSSESTSVVVGGYLCSFSEMQKDNYSIDAQKRAIIEGYKLCSLPEPIFFEDDERSAHREQIDNRPAFNWTKPSMGCVSMTSGTSRSSVTGLHGGSVLMKLTCSS